MIVDSFASILNLEFTIINAEPMKRISATGIYKEAFEQKDWSGTYTKMAIENKSANSFKS